MLQVLFQAKGRNVQRYLILILALCLSAPPVRCAPPRSGYTQTRYPIVLVHGLFGFSSLAGVDYFYRIPEALRQDGAQVFVTEVDPVNTSEVRGEQLLAQVQEILAITGASKVNLIGHSQGAPTARYVAAVRPDLVASVTSVGGVNRGSAVADRLLALSVDDGLWRQAARTAMLALSPRHLSAPEFSAALNDLSTEGSLRFNAKYPAGVPDTPCGSGALKQNGVRYYSWSGSSILTNPLDPADVPLLLLGQAFSEPSDGLVGHCSSHLGLVLRDDFRMNHLNEINQMLGLVSPFEVSPVTLYRQQANRLKLAGL